MKMLSPVVGGLFVLFFPVALVVALAATLARALVQPLVALWRRHVYLAEARWEPSAAYVAHARERVRKGQAPAMVDDLALDAAELAPDLDPSLSALAEEVEARRREEA